MDGILELVNSPNIELKIIEGKGRCLFAISYLKKGDTIFEENPLVSCQFAWNKTYRYLTCDHCMRPLENVEENINRLTGNKCFELPYLECDPTIKANHRKCNNCGEKYCSKECLINAWNQYHQFLCYQETDNEILFQLVEYWKKMHYPPETTNILLLARLLCTIQSAENKELAYNTLMQFCHLSTSDDETLVHNLLGEKYQFNLDELWRLFNKVILSRFNNSASIDTLLTREGFIKMFSLIGRNGQGIGTSVLAEWTKKIINSNESSKNAAEINHLVDAIYTEVEKHAGTFIDNEGSGLYILQSCINHSCSANAKITFPFNYNRLALVAKRDIMPGEEILINYLDKCSRKRSCHSRRKILRDNYLFICTCTKCVTDSVNETDVTSDEDDDDYENENDNGSTDIVM